MDKGAGGERKRPGGDLMKEAKDGVRCNESSLSRLKASASGASLWGSWVAPRAHTRKHTQTRNKNRQAHPTKPLPLRVHFWWWLLRLECLEMLVLLYK